MSDTLWGGTGGLAEEIAAFTAAGDRQWDRRLAAWDVLGTLGHVEGLAVIGVLDGDEAAALRRVLREIWRDARRGAFTVTDADEDVHTALERTLVARLGAVGEKVHTGRSRNDQVLVDLRLYCKDRLLELSAAVLDLAAALTAFARRHARVVWPGYTHQRRAMPSTVGLWAGSFAEALLDDLTPLRGALELVDRSPLGSAAGYGVPLPLPRELVAERLGFAAVQGNVAAVQPSRGKLDVVVLGAAWTVAHDLARLAWDVILFSAEEFGFLTIPGELATGSSIMPHKANPDVFELTRGRAGLVGGWLAQAVAVAGSLPSGYHRDLQLMKEPLMRGLDTVGESVDMMRVAVPRLGVDRRACAAAVGGGMLATDEVFRRVREGTPFRQAYREVAESVRGGAAPPALAPAEILGARVSTGAPGNPGLAALGRRIRREQRRAESARARFEAAQRALVGGEERS